MKKFLKGIQRGLGNIAAGAVKVAGGGGRLVAAVVAGGLIAWGVPPHIAGPAGQAAGSVYESVQEEGSHHGSEAQE